MHRVEARVGLLLLGEAGEDRLLGGGDRVLALELVADAEGRAHRLAAGGLGACS